MLGLFALNPMGIQGAVLQMVNHGLSTGALFLLVGMIYERRHSRMIATRRSMEEVPSTRIFVVALSIGLPGLNGFGELLTSWARSLRPGSRRSCAILGCLGVIIWQLPARYKRVFYGEPKPHRDGPMMTSTRSSDGRYASGGHRLA